MNELEDIFVREARSEYGGRPRSHRELRVYQQAFRLALRIHEVANSFPEHERFSLTSQMRRSSRSVCGNLAEAWRKRRYKAAFIAKLSDSEAEAGETQAWLEFCKELSYLPATSVDELWDEYEQLIGTVVGFINNADKWIIM